MIIFKTTTDMLQMLNMFLSCYHEFGNLLTSFPAVSHLEVSGDELELLIRTQLLSHDVCCFCANEIITGLMAYMTNNEDKLNLWFW